MEMLAPEAQLIERSRIRPLSRFEFARLGAEGFFDDEQVELLFGMVVTVPAPSPGHTASEHRVRRMLESMIGDRAEVLQNGGLAATEDSLPAPDVFVVPPGRDIWKETPTRAHLVVEVAHTTLSYDRGAKALLYALSDVEEYWIVNLDAGQVEVYRDRDAGVWRTKTTHGRGETIAPRAFPDVQIPVSEIVPPAGT